MANEHLDTPFTYRRYDPNTFIIQGEGCDSYLLLGEKEGLMIDTGQSRRNLKEYVQTITDLPVNKVINTHGHFDHTGGNGFFSEIYMHPYAVDDAKRVFGDPADFPLDYTIQTTQEGDTFDLGGRVLEIYDIGSHSSGSIAILDVKNRMLFTGDEVESQQTLLLGSLQEMLNNEKDPADTRPRPSVERHQRNMKKLLAMASRFDFMFPAHNGTPICNDYLEAYIEAAQRVLDGTDEGSTDIASPTYGPHLDHFPKDTSRYRRATYKGASLIYRLDLVFDE
jgi:hydroxyacylglutathione hydrolase